MKLTGSYSIPAAREQVFAALVDPDVLGRCMDGAESLVACGDGEYTVQLRLGVGPLKGAYAGRVRLSEKVPPERFVLHVEGKGTPGFVRGRADIQLDERDAGTTVTCQADGQVGGLIAAVGSRLIEAAGRTMMDRFFDALRVQVVQSSAKA